MLAMLLGCGKVGTSTADPCQVTKDCRAAQVCWCDHGESSRCLDGDDLPAGICVSREERRQRDCVARGKPSNCRDAAGTPTATPIPSVDRVQGVAEVDGASLKVKISEPRKPPPLRGGNASDDSSEALDMGRVYQTYSKYGGQLGGCLQSTGESQANVYIEIDGPSGRVTSARINGKQNGALHDCASRVLRAMKFPVITGPRTRAEFDVAL
jgi:hypothetical protein